MFVTNFTEQPETLYRNMGKGEFSDVTWPAKLAQPTYTNVGWGTGFVDFSNSGLLDIFIANGHVYPQMDQIAGAARYAEPMQLFRNKGDGTFDDISGVLAGIPGASRRGAAFGDLNNDGNVDVVVLDMDGPPQLLLNVSANGNHRVLFKLVGTKSNKMGIGAKLVVISGKITQTAEVRAGGSYLSSNDPRLHFGLGADDRMSQVEIRWPMGEKEILKDVPADFIYTVTEGKGITDKQALPAVK
jgi:enediyne biosynthesis protein E4